MSSPSHRSIKAANESCASAPVGRAVSTRIPRSRAISIADSHNVVFPIPGPPVSISAPGAARNSLSVASSGARPTIVSAYTY